MKSCIFARPLPDLSTLIYTISLTHSVSTYLRGLFFMTKTLLVAGLVFLLHLSVTGQKGYELGGFAGISYYTGDINPSFSLKSPGPTIAGVARYNFNSRTSLRLDASVGRLIGKDALSENSFQKMRNLSFRTDYFDASLDIEFNFFNLIHGSRDQFYTPYIYGGFVLAYYNPKAKLDGTWYALRELGTEGQRPGKEYNQISAGLAYGLGFKVDFNYEWSLNVELAVRQLGTDYLDDVSTVYPDMNQLRIDRGDIAVLLSDRSIEVTDNPIGAPFRQRGNQEDKDTYYSLRVGLVYYIGILQCPALSRPHR